MSKGKLEFKVGSKLKNIIGKDLITDDFIAVFELVKNSYDAHAKNVVITFEDNKITIADNGKGMSLEDLKNKWLFVAYSAKEDGTEDDEFEEKKESYRDLITERRRHYAGAKGIGRFSCDRLGKSLKITTLKIKELETTILNVDWLKFEEDAKKEFQNIELEYETILQNNVVFPKQSNHGTILEIKDTAYWDRKKILELKHSLEKLINPFSEADEFTIEIKSTKELKEDIQGRYTKNPDGYKDADLIGKPYLDRDKVNGVVKNSILDVLDLKTTQISVKIDCNIIKTTLKDRGTNIYQIEEKNRDYPFIDNLQMDLYYLNTSAKNNFTRRMGVSVVNFGSVFLFKNGFRVQPYGEAGDDSWSLDYRAQQGYSRYLGTRDLFGRIDIITDRETQFKEVTSRDGGLVDTEGFRQLELAFKENALKRLERYVVGVLWGEGFKKRNYFKTEEEADKFRDNLKDIDKYSDNIDIVKSNIGSKLDFIQIIKSLSSDNNVKVISYDKDFINLVNEKIDEHQYKFISDLEKIAERTNDEQLKKQILRTEEQYQFLLIAKEEEENKRVEAEKKAKEAERQKVQAEAERQKAEERRKKAELETEKKEKERLKAENKRILAENARLKAEQKAQEEEEKRKQEEEARKKAEREVKVEKEQNRYLLATSNTSKEVKELIHTININSADINSIIRRVDDIIEEENIQSVNLLKEIEALKFNAEKIELLGKLINKADFNTLKEKSNINIPLFIKEYIEIYEKGSKIKFDIKGSNIQFNSMIDILDIYIILDNLISNSKKSNATQIHFTMKIQNNELLVDVSDNGDGLSDKYMQNPKDIFKIGITDKRGGSGIGLYTLKTKMKYKLRGDISFLGNALFFKQGATFRLTFRK